jgi:hypothetical protein
MHPDSKLFAPERRQTALRLLAYALGCLIAAAPGIARAESCSERSETCVETCKVDYGMETDRKLLTRCLSHCQEKLEDCRDLNHEERARRRDDWEPAPAERKQRTDESVGREDRETGERRQRIEDSFDRAETRAGEKQAGEKQADENRSASDDSHGGIEDFGTTQGSERQESAPVDSEAKSDSQPDPYKIDSSKDASPAPSSERSEPPDIPPDTPDSSRDGDNWTGE